MSDTIRFLLGDSDKPSGSTQHQKELKRYGLPPDASIDDLEKARKEFPLLKFQSEFEAELYEHISGKSN